MQEANRSYEANLQVVKMVREMLAIQVDLLRTE
jgi:flagellar basal body rod protein FlgC